MNYDKILKDNVVLVFQEPWTVPCSLDAYSKVHITAQKAVEYQKSIALNKNCTYKDDIEALSDFMIVHWAVPQDKDFQVVYNGYVYVYNNDGWSGCSLESMYEKCELLIPINEKDIPINVINLKKENEYGC